MILRVLKKDIKVRGDLGLGCTKFGKREGELVQIFNILEHISILLEQIVNKFGTDFIIFGTQVGTDFNIFWYTTQVGTDFNIFGTKFIIFCTLFIIFGTQFKKIWDRFHYFWYC